MPKRSSVRKRIVIVAELSIHPIGAGTSVGNHVRVAVRALSRIKGLRYQVTPMSTVLEAEKLETILAALAAAHRALRSMGAKRISSMLRVDERLDKKRTMEEKARSVRTA